MSYILLTLLLAPVWWPTSLLRNLLNPQPKRILILEIAGIGDVVCSTHLFQQLRAHYPNAQIDLVVDPIAETLAPLLTMVDRVIAFPYARQKGLLGRLRLALLCSRYDTGISLIPSAAQLTGFCWAAMPRRLSILPSPLNSSYRALRPCLTASEVHQSGAYFLGTQASLLAQLGVPAPDASKWLPAEAVKPQSVTAPIQIGLLVSSGRALKRIEPDKLIEIVTGLLALQPGVEIVLIGGPGDKALAQSLVSGLSETQRVRVVDTVGQYKLYELPAQLKQLALLVGVDSGITHMADALGVSIVCVAGPVDLQEVYQPGCNRCQLTAALPCYPCSTVFDTPSQCHTGDLACLKQLDARQVVQAAHQRLETNRPV
jgi:ADP-heptose:LPS heptosyltransferase